MSINPMFTATDCTPRKVLARARLTLALTGLLFSAQGQAFLPTPVSLVTTGELAPQPLLAMTNSTVHTMSEADITSIRDSNESMNNEAQDAQSVNVKHLLTIWREQAKADNLAQHTTWRRLLYFFDDKKNLFGKQKIKSATDSPDFFLSANGQQDSGAELDAMLVAIAEELTTSDADDSVDSKTQTRGNESVLCRFPARVQWLTDTLDIDETRLQASCPELDDWIATLAPEQLSIVFAQEYLDNPTSAFAHTLLRIDSKASATDKRQINHAYTLNYTVDGNPDAPFIVYAIQSMVGSYDNAIEIDPYPEKLAKYLQDDERDTWTYQLNLTPQEVRQIMFHVWETKDLALPYYFTTDNCASEILRLIDVVRPQQQLLSQLPYAVVPSDVIQLLDKKGLLANTDYTPADSTIRQAQLNETKRAHAKLGYKNIVKDRFDEIRSAQKNLVSSLSADGQTLLTRPIAVADNNPIDRHPLQMGQIGLGYRGDNRYIDIGLRAGYHDSLDRPAGFSQFFNLEGVDTIVRLYDKNDTDANPSQSVVLQNFTLIRGRSFNPVNTAKKGKTWGASIEATRIDDGSQQEGVDHLVASMRYEAGLSWAFGSLRNNSSDVVTGEMPPQLCYTFATGAAQAGRGITKGFRVGVGMSAGCRYQINNQLRAQAELQLPYWYHGDSSAPYVHGHYWQPITTLGLQYDIDKRQALRLNASHDWQDRIDANDDIQLSYRRYF